MGTGSKRYVMWQVQTPTVPKTAFVSGWECLDIFGYGLQIHTESGGASMSEYETD